MITVRVEGVEVQQESTKEFFFLSDLPHLAETGRSLA